MSEFDGPQPVASRGFKSSDLNTGNIDLRVNVSNEQAVKQMLSLAEALGLVNTKAAAVGKTLKVISTLGGIGAVLNVFSSLAGKVVEVAEESTRVKTVFNNLSISLEEAQVASRGMISEFDLAKKANEAMRLGIVATGEDFAQLVESATLLGTSVGIDATDALDKLTTAIARQSTRRLDDLGIMLTQQQAYDIYAAQLGKTADALSEEEKQQAFSTVAKQRAIEMAKGVAFENDALAVKTQRAAVAVEDYKNRVLGADPAVGKLNQKLRGLSEEQLLAIERFGDGTGSSKEYAAALRAAGLSTKDYKDKTQAAAAATRLLNLRMLENAKIALANAQREKDKRDAAADEVSRTIELQKAKAKLAGDTEWLRELDRKALRLEAARGEITQEELKHKTQLLGIEEQIADQKEREKGRGRGGTKRDPLKEAEDLRKAEVEKLEIQVRAAERIIEVKKAEGEEVFALEQQLAESHAMHLERLGEGEKAEEIRHDALLARIERRKTLEEEEAERKKELADKIEKIEAELEKKRKARAKAEEKRLKEQAQHIEKAFDTIVGTQVQGFTKAVIAATESKDSFKEVFAEEVREFAKARAMQLGAQATMHFVKAAAFGALALTNPFFALKAKSEGIAGGIALAGAAGLAATYGISVAASGKGAGAGGEAGGGGGGSPFNLGGGTREGFDDPEAPVSPLEPLGGSNPQSASKAPGATTIIVEGSIVDGEKLMRIIQDQERTFGRFRA